jgi:RNA polymerase sigma-70 factor (ECF subfamily)
MWVNLTAAPTWTEGHALVLEDQRPLPDDHSDPLTALVHGAQAGNEDSFMALWRALQPALLRYLRLRAPGHHEDVASETWLQVVKSIREFRGDADAFKQWLFTLARNRAIDAARSSQRKPLVLVAQATDLDGRSSPSAEHQALERVSTDQALALLSTLPPEQGEVVALRILADLDVEAVALITGRTPGAVRVTCHRALRALAAQPSTSRVEVS